MVVLLSVFRHTIEVRNVDCECLALGIRKLIDCQISFCSQLNQLIAYGSLSINHAISPTDSRRIIQGHAEFRRRR